MRLCFYNGHVRRESEPEMSGWALRMTPVDRNRKVQSGFGFYFRGDGVNCRHD